MCYVIMKIYFLFTLLFIMENNEKKQKVNKIVDLIGFFFLNLQRKILNIKVIFNVFNDVDSYIYVSNICNLPLLQMAY